MHERLKLVYPFILGLDVDGLYRVSGNLAVIQKLRFAVNHGKFSSTTLQLHSFSDCLKRKDFLMCNCSFS